jgi:hypothetical protein
MSETPISPLRARMIEDKSVRKFGDNTQNDYIRHVKTYAQIRITRRCVQLSTQYMIA